MKLINIRKPQKNKTTKTKLKKRVIELGRHRVINFELGIHKYVS